MKTTHSEWLRLKALSAKADALSADEVKELASLKTKAAAESIDLTKLDEAIAAKAAGVETTDEELTTLISKAVADALSLNKLDHTEVIDAIKQAAKDGGAKALTPEKVEEIVKKHLGGEGIDQKALVDAVKAAIPKDHLTGADLAKALDEFAKSVRQPTKMVFEDPYVRDFPIEHRAGNLSVAEKQLLNICMKHVSEEKQHEMKSKGLVVPQSMNDGITEEQLKRARLNGDVAAKRARHEALYGKALTTGGSGSGAELIPTDLSGELMTRLYLESQLAAELVASEIDMPTSPFEFPLATTRTRFYTGSEAPGSDPTTSEPGTSKIILNAAKLIGVSEYSYESDEDAIIAVLPMLLENMSSGAADALEGAIINGDTTATHMDSDTAAGNHAKLFKGLRKYAMAGSVTKSLSSGNISAANIAAMRKQMSRWGVRPRDLMLIVGPNGYNDVVNLPETLTFDKVGNANAARILTGEAGSIYGIRIVVSSQVREDLNASGVYDGTTTTKGSILLVHRPSWILGVRRGFTVEVDVDKKRQINSVIASFRRDFKPKETPSTSIPTVVLGYNNVA